MADKSSVNPDNLSLSIPDLEDFRRERTQGTPAHQALAWLKVYAKLSGEKLPYNLSGGPAIRQTKRKRGKAAGAAVAGGTDAGAELAQQEAPVLTKQEAPVLAQQEALVLAQQQAPVPAQQKAPVPAQQQAPATLTPALVQLLVVRIARVSFLLK